jgi:transposase
MAKVPKAASRKQTGPPAQRSVPERKASSRPSPKGKGNRRGADLSVKNPDAAGIDVGARVHYVAVPEDRAQPSIRSFGAYTAQLEELVQWLQACGIKTVAMESTGVYWIALYQKLEAAGFEVLLVDARRAKHVPGRKSDVQDCRWLQQLHSYGLLAPAFRPEDAICRLRTLQRHRKSLVECAAMWIQHLQKALTEMNLHRERLANPI